jgi:hypothetical protein
MRDDILRCKLHFLFYVLAPLVYMIQWARILVAWLWKWALLGIPLSCVLSLVIWVFISKF